MPDIIDFTSFGISGLIFVMWWIERYERIKVMGHYKSAVEKLSFSSEMVKQMISVVEKNTAALEALRHELHSCKKADGLAE